MFTWNEIEKSEKGSSQRLPFQPKCLLTLAIICLLAIILIVYYKPLQVWPTYHTRKIHIRSQGRLGNIMYQVAALYGICKRTARVGVYHFKDNAYNRDLLKHFLIHRVPIEFTFIDLTKKEVKNMLELNADKDPESMNDLPDSDVIVCCYLSGNRFWKEFSSDIKLMFNFGNHSLQTALRTIDGIKTKVSALSSVKITLIGVHVRRGDFIKKYGNDYLPKPSYFRRSMDYFIEMFPNTTCVFLVTSNDIPWCNANLNFPKKHIYFVRNQTALEDMETLRQCDHVIMSKGTFGWWAGYLAGGQVIFHTPQKHKSLVLPNGTIKHSLNSGNSRFKPEFIPISD